MSDQKFTGKIKKTDLQKNYWFIEKGTHNAPVNGDIFFHKGSLLNSSYRPQPGDTVEFKPIQGKEGKEADQVNCLSAHTPPPIPQNFVSPYTFITVRDELLNEHALYPTSNKQALSGVIHYQLTALTPLLVGQHQYKAENIAGAKPITDSDIKAIQPPGHWGLDRLNAKKAVLEPLMIPLKNEQVRRVVIPGSSLKGMLRHSIGALFNAPMERVGEQYFSYRPNMSVSSANNNRFICREAVVLAANADTNEIEVLLTSPTSARNAIFVRDRVDLTNVHTPTTIAGNKVRGILKGVSLSNVRHHKDDKTNRLIHASKEKWLSDCDYLLLDYKGGLDGNGELATAFGTEVYHKALLPKHVLETTQSVKITSNIVSHYLRTRLELANDELGHISKRHPRIGENTQGSYNKKANASATKKAIKDNTSCVINANQLIYVEWDTHEKAIVSFGPNFLYRWAYGDTIRQVNDPKTNQLKPRPELNPLPGEHVNQASGKLSAARLFFGYSVESSANVAKGSNPATQEIGEGDYARMAGRIAINSAIEHLDKNHATLSDRFLLSAHRQKNYSDEQRLSVPLKPLGSPKASAVEHYLDQSQLGQRGFAEETVTYGDLPGAESLANQQSKLNGRKFYRHQLMQAGNANFEEQNPDAISSDQSTLARYISKPNSQFRFSLRFKNLQRWELGAMLLTLEPDLLFHTNLERPPLLDAFLQKIKRDNTSPTFAHKLGYARPLGLGSISLSHQKVSFLPTDATEALNLKEATPEFVTDALNACLNKFVEKQLLPNLIDWLRVINFQQRKPADYPKNAKDSTYGYHSDIRRTHARTRRLAVSYTQPNKYAKRVNIIQENN